MVFEAELYQKGKKVMTKYYPLDASRHPTNRDGLHN